VTKPADNDDARYIDAAAKKMGVDPTLLAAVVAEGVDIGDTAKAEIRDAFGLDPDLNRRNAIEATALTLGDKIKANGGDTSIALAELRSGSDRAVWGKDTQKFVQRVGSRRTASGIQMQPGAGQRTASGAAPVDAPSPSAPIEPMAAAAAGEPEAPAEVAKMQPGAPMMGPKTLAAYNDGTMPDERRARIEQKVAQGLLQAPPGWKPMAAPAPAPEAPGLVDRAVSGAAGAAGAVKEMVTGDARKTALSEGSMDITMSPEWRQLQQMGLAGVPQPGVGNMVKQGVLTGVDAMTGGMAGAVKRLGAEGASPQEQVQIIEANFPGTKAVADEKGNLSFRSSDGQTYSTKPGLGPEDIIRGLVQIAPAVATGGAAAAGRVLGGAALGAGGQLAMEAGQALAGGSVDPTEVALAGIAGGAVPAAGKVLQGARGAMQPVAREVLPDAATVVAQKVGARGTVPMADDELAGLVKRAASDGKGADVAKLQLAERVAVNPEAKAAADRLGIELPADVFSDSPQIRAAIGGLRAKVGSEAEAGWRNTVGAAVDKADEVLAKFDADPSPGAASQKVLDTLQSTRGELKDKAAKLYEAVDAQVPDRTPIKMDNVRKTIMEIAEDVGTEGLSAPEKRLLGRIKSGDVPYGALREEKDLIGKALRREESPYGSMSERRLKRLYAALAEDQLANVERVGGEGLRKQLRAANLLTAKQKALEGRITTAFGREADGSIASLMRQAVTDASAGNGAKMAKLLKVVPKELQGDVVATALSTLSRAKGGAEAGRFGFSEFAKVYGGLRSKGNESAFAQVSSVLGPERSAAMRDLYEISKRITDARALVATTGKANQPFMQALTAEGLVEKVMSSAIGRAATAGAGGMAGGPLGAAGASMLVEGLTKGNRDVVARAGKLFASPEFQALAIEAATKPQVSKPAIRRVVTSPSFTAFAKAAKLPRDLTARERYILDALAVGRANRPEGE
jgi:hypothetical protein